MIFALIPVFLFLGVLLYRTLKSPSLSGLFRDPEAFIISQDWDPLLQRFSSYIQIPTVGHHDYGENRIEHFLAFQEKVKSDFGGTEVPWTIDCPNPYQIIIHWESPLKDKGDPILFLAHYDVVPVREELWQEPPFSGRIKEGFIWGRGTIDTKSTLVGLLEALRLVQRQGFQPKQDLYLAFAGDEETSSRQGALSLAAEWKAQGLRFQWILDEGGAIITDAIPGMDQSLALVGVAEKGFVNYKLTSTSPGGHASAPPPKTAVARIAGALHRLEAARRYTRLPRAAKDFFSGSARLFPPLQRLIMANLWLFSPLLIKILAKRPLTAAQVQSTIASTMVKGSGAPNVLAPQAWGVVNSRLLPGDTIAKSRERLKKIVNDPQVEVSLLDPIESNDPVLPQDAEYPELVLFHKALQGLVDAAGVVPYLNTGSTDSKHYAELSRRIYRFAPYQLSSADLGLMHAPNERLSVENYQRVVCFYKNLFKEICYVS